MFDWKDIPRPIVALSPMADMTDSAFCRIAKRFGAPVMFREMVSSDGLTYGNEKTREMCAFHDDERPLIQQVFGADPERMAESVRIIDAEFGPDGFDINMGCPVYKITSNFNGAALMREPERAKAIIRAMKAATEKPVSVKMRLGWEDPTEILEFIRHVEDAGADLVTVHGRTKAQAYSGVADWEMVGRARERVSVPVLVNGDVFDAAAAKRAIDASGCAGVLVARGALGSPWIFREIRAALAGEPVPEVSTEEFVSTIRDHAALHAAQYGGSLVTFRKHLTWYFKGRRGAKTFRERAVRISTTGDLEPILAEYLEEMRNEGAKESGSGN